MSNLNQEIIQRHMNVKSTARRWLRDAGFKACREVCGVIGEDLNQDVFTFWIKGSVILIEHAREPMEAAVSRLPLYDLYESIDTTNDMKNLHSAIRVKGMKGS